MAVRETENATILLLTDRNLELQRENMKLTRELEGYRATAQRPVFATMNDSQIFLLAQLLAEHLGADDKKKEFVN